jgi:hypothetical protein
VKRPMIIVGLVVALAIPTGAFAAGHRAHHKGAASTTAPKTGAKGSAPRTGVAVTMKRSKSVPASSKTKASSKPKAGTRSSRKPKARASGGRAKSSMKVKRNGTAGTPGISVNIGQGVGTGASGTPGMGGIALPTSINGIGA